MRPIQSYRRATIKAIPRLAKSSSRKYLSQLFFQVLSRQAIEGNCRHHRRMQSFVQRLDRIAWDHKDSAFRQKALEEWQQKKINSRSNAIDESKCLSGSLESFEMNRTIASAVGTFEVEVPG